MLKDMGGAYIDAPFIPYAPRENVEKMGRCLLNLCLHGGTLIHRRRRSRVTECRVRGSHHVEFDEDVRASMKRTVLLLSLAISSFALSACSMAHLTGHSATGIKRRPRPATCELAVVRETEVAMHFPK